MTTKQFLACIGDLPRRGWTPVLLGAYLRLRSPEGRFHFCYCPIVALAIELTGDLFPINHNNAAMRLDLLDSARDAIADAADGADDADLILRHLLLAALGNE